MGINGPVKGVRTMGVRGKSAPQHGEQAERPEPPRHLGAEERREFRVLVDRLLAANVPLRDADTYALEMVAKSQVILRRPDLDPAMFARFSRDMQSWLEMLGGTPRSRVRMGTPAQTVQKELSPAEQAIAAIAGPVVLI